MITRVADSVFEDFELELILKNLKLNQRKLIAVVKSKQEAEDMKRDLISKKYNSTYEQQNGFYNVFYSEQPKVKADKKILSHFYNIGNNHFALNVKSALAGIYDYAYDDGSIWTLRDIDGEQFLVKELNSDDENDVIRQKK